MINIVVPWMFFSSSIFISEILCPEPPTVDNGWLVRSDNKPGSLAVYVCGVGYRLHSSNSLTCSESGQWSDERILCQGEKLKIFSIVHLR